MLAVAALLRLGAAAYYAGEPLSRGGDDRQYVEIARNLAQGRGFMRDERPTAYRAPGYPLFLAAVFKLGGGLAAARVAQAVLGTLTVLLLFFMVEAAAGERAGVVAAALLAALPEQVLLPATLHLEVFYAPFVLGVGWALVRWRRKRSRRRLGVLGLAAGLSLCVRSTLAPALPVFLLWRLVELRDLRRFFQESAVFLVCLGAPLAPWVLRNAARFERFIPFESGVAGPNLYFAASGRLRNPPSQVDDEVMRDMYARTDENDWDAVALGHARSLIAAHPLRYLKTSLARVVAFWTDAYTPYLLHGHRAWARWLEEGRRWDALSWATRLGRGLLLALAVFGVWTRRRETGLVWLAALLGYFDVYALTTVFARFFAPLTPLLAGLAALGALEWRSLSNRLNQASPTRAQAISRK